ncbi:MAG: protein-methionine-sulfoxide reductase catalytic subunit MsrP [Parvibaculaceae bacterium]|nr:protein-methionine-sulfoxide reductase catalytic subunit MsrP [Parvibaculaceae bacterium]
MLVRSKRRWEIPEREATPEHLFLNRRGLLKSAGLVAAGASALSFGAAGSAFADGAMEGIDPADKTLGLYPARRNPAFALDRAVTPEALTSKYNNFYEFGSSKSIYDEAQNLKTRPWEITIDGEVDKTITIGIDDLVAKMPLEERLYRHRCVEAWSMAVPWTGFPLKALVDLAQPKSGTKYLQMQTFQDASMAPGQNQFWYPWPYTEGLTMAEATNELAFMATGVYGKPLLKQFGAPLRLAVPWKYGFKSVKSVTRFTFTNDRPTTFWEALGPDEYGFWANVNPDVPHPRWSQASEEVLGTGNRVPTLLFNGYGEEVAALYKDLQGEKLYM